jgi:hypothetical protein
MVNREGVQSTCADILVGEEVRVRIRARLIESARRGLVLVIISNRVRIGFLIAPVVQLPLLAERRFTLLDLRGGVLRGLRGLGGLGFGLVYECCN